MIKLFDSNMNEVTIKREMKELQSDFDLLMKSLPDKGVDPNE